MRRVVCLFIIVIFRKNSTNQQNNNATAAYIFGCIVKRKTRNYMVNIQPLELYLYAKMLLRFNIIGLFFSFSMVFFLAHSSYPMEQKMCSSPEWQSNVRYFQYMKFFWLNWIELKPSESNETISRMRFDVWRKTTTTKHTHKSNEHIKTVKQRKINYLLEMEHRNKEIIWYFRIIRLNKGKIMWP